MKYYGEIGEIEYKRTDPIYYLWLVNKKSAKQRGLLHTIVPEDLSIPVVCPILGIPLSYKMKRANIPSVDRVDNSKGYVSGNVQVISYEANRLKSNLNLETLEKITTYIKNNT